MFFSWPNRQPHGSRKKPSRWPSRPLLEALEDRITPTTVAPTTFADGAIGTGSLRSDVGDANNGADANTSGAYIISLSAGTYTLTSGPLLLNNTNAGTSIILQGKGTGASGTILSAGGLSQILSVANGTNVILENLSIQGGKTTTGGIGGFTATGGGLVNDGGNVTLSNVSFTSNSAAAASNAVLTGSGSSVGGAIFSLGGTLTLDSVTLQKNKAIGDVGKPGAGAGTVGGFAAGGGLAEAGTIVVTNVPTTPATPADPGTALTAAFNPSTLKTPLLTVSTNSATGGNGGTGTAAHPIGTAGGAADGGGLYLEGGTVSLVAVSVSGNTAQGGAGGTGLATSGVGGTGGSAVGGGLFVTAQASVGANVTLQAGTLANNVVQGGKSGNGGTATGAKADGGDAEAAGSATGGGLADANATDTVTLLNDTVAFNKATGGVGGTGGAGKGTGSQGNDGAGGNAAGAGLAFTSTGDNGDTVTNATVAYNVLQGGAAGGAHGNPPTGVAEGGGVFSAATPVGTTGPAPILVNTFIADNTFKTTTPVGPDEYGPLNFTATTGSRNDLVADATGSSFVTGVNSDITSVASPGLAAALASGTTGPTQVLALSTGSPAIGAGDASVLASIGNQDQIGEARATTDDIGAVQYIPTPTPTPTPTSSPDTVTLAPVTGLVAGMSSQSVNVSATVTSPDATGNVAEGQVTFTLFNAGNVQVGNPVTFTLTATQTTAATSLTLPGGTPAGSNYTLQASYVDPSHNFANETATTTVVIAGAGVTVAAAPLTAISAGESAQPVDVSADITSSGGTVNSGTVTFSLTNLAGETVGTPVTANVTAGKTATPETFVVPAGTAAGSYTLTESYADNNPGVFAAGSAQTTLTINPAAVTVTPATLNGLSTSESVQSVAVSADVTSPGGTINSGAVTFALFNGDIQVGKSVKANVTAGQTAAQQLAIPASAPSATYSVVETYADTSGVFATVSNSTPLVVARQMTTLTPVALGTLNTSAGAQPVSVSAGVSSAGGDAINSGTVTFTLFNGNVQVGTPVKANVTAGQTAAVNLTVPGGTASGSYTLKEAYADSAGLFASGNGTTTLVINAAPAVQLPSPPPPPPSLPPTPVQLFIDGFILAFDLFGPGGASAALANAALIADIDAAPDGLFNPFLLAGLFAAPV